MQVATLIESVLKVTKTQAEIARRLGVSTTEVSDWKQGRRACPPDAVARLADMAGQDPMEALIEAVTERLSAERKEGLRQALTHRAKSFMNHY